MGNAKVENIIAETKIADGIDLEEIAKILPGARRDPTNYPGLVVGVSANNVAYIIFESGRVICTGAKNIDEIRRCLNEIVKILKRKGIGVKGEIKPKIRSVTVSTEIGHAIDLEKAVHRMDGAEYRPEEIPAVVCTGENGLTALIFDSGKVVCIGSGEKEVGNFIKDIVKKIREVE